MSYRIRSTALLVFCLLSAQLFAATVQINQSGLTFDPDTITIQAGDTVEWNWSGGSHTVTSGTGAADPDVGLLFDEPLNSSNPTVSYTFDTAGDYPYFCRPHELCGMTGIIHVLEPPAYIRIGVAEGGEPSAQDCADPAHYGRMIAHPVAGLYLCGQVGWQLIEEITPP